MSVPQLDPTLSLAEKWDEAKNNKDPRVQKVIEKYELVNKLESTRAVLEEDMAAVVKAKEELQTKKTAI